MSLLSTADFIAAARFLRLLTMPYEKTAAFKESVIDKDGNLLIPVREMDQKQKNSYTIFHRLVFNIRRLLSKVPVVGRSILLNYASALMLIRENVKEFKNIDEKLLFETMNKAGFDVLNETVIIYEDTGTAFSFEIGEMYTLNKDILNESTFEPIYKEGSEIVIESLSKTHRLFDIPFFYARHLNTNHRILVSEGDVVTVQPTMTTGNIGSLESEPGKNPTFIKKRKKKNKVDNENV